MDQPTTFHKYKLFWAWEDEKEEAWLEEMSNQGYHLQHAAPFSYTFTPGEPRPYAYRLDFQTQTGLEREAYLQLFQDAGWELVGEMNGWFYFRKLRQPGEPVEIFTDRESKIAKYQRLLGWMVVIMPVWMFFILLIRPNERPGPFTMILGLLYLVLMLFYAYAVINLIRRINHLKRP